MKRKKYYITTAIVYTSKKPHIGNTYEAVLADSIARFKRLLGYDVFFLTGTDEHGQKIQQVARENGITPKQHVDKVAGQIKDIWDMMNTSYDKFIRTTDGYHEKAVQNIFKSLYNKGDIYKGKYKGLYCTPCESFFTETQLVEGKCPDCKREVQKTEEEAYFFKLGKYQDKLIKYIEDNPGFIQPESRKNEMMNNFLKKGLQDLCVSRTSFDWGVPVTFDGGHVIYVWIDALSNYITALGFDPEGECGELYNNNWPADVHLIGKDILRFHTIYWPIMLMALELPLPRQVFGHPWLLVGSDKMSKSKGNVLYADDLVKHFGVDAVRYYVLHEMPFAQDGTITYELLISRINSDLSNILGNLVNRTLAMINKYFDGIIIKGREGQPVDEELKSMAMSTVENTAEKMEKLKVSEAMDEIWNLLRRSNKYIDETMPWILGRDGSKKDRLAAVLYNLAEVIRIASVLLGPFMPETAAKIQQQINTKDVGWDSIQDFGKIREGTKVGEASPLFVRIDEKKKMDEIGNAEKSSAENKKGNKKIKETGSFENITIDDFAKIDLRVAKVLEAEKIEGTDKLIKFKLKLGDEVRQVVSGIAKYYKPDELKGMDVILVANLKPVKLKGVESQGMILTASGKKDLVLLTTDKDTDSGNKVS